MPAFIGVEGFGKDTVGARDASATVVFVTNTNDSGAGSLRAALETDTGPRYVIFRVGGTITLLSQINIVATDNNIHIAGQTAPGGGILLKDHGITCPLVERMRL